VKVEQHVVPLLTRIAVTVCSVEMASSNFERSESLLSHGNVELHFGRGG